METQSNRLAKLLEFCIDKRAQISTKLLHAYILRKGLVFNTFLMNRLVEAYSKCCNMAYAHHVFEQIPAKDVFSWNAVLGAHCKAGDLERAHEVFAKMPGRNEVSWNNMISALVRAGLERKALEFYDGMVSGGFEPTRFTLASVFSACGAAADLDFGRRCHGLAFKIGLDENVFVSNAVLSMYTKCGFVNDAIRAFRYMAEPNEVTFTALMSGLAQTDRVIEALELFRTMMRKGIFVDSVSLSSVMGVFSREGLNEFEGNNAKQCHCLTVKLGFDGDLHLNNSLLDMYAKKGDMDSAEKVFSNLTKVNIVSWNVMIAGFGQRFQTEKALEYIHRMCSLGFEPDEVTYINMLAGCVKSGDLETGRRVFDKMPTPSVSSWNAMLSGYAQSGDHFEVMKLFREMLFRVHGERDRTTLAVALSSCSGLGVLEAGKEIHGASIKALLHTDAYVASGLIGLYSKCSKMESTERIFQSTPNLDSACWNSMISGLSLNSKDTEAFLFFKQMRQARIFPTQFSYATVLSCCAKLSSSFHGKQVHCLATKHGFTSDVFVGTALVDMYCKCGDVDGSRRFFDAMSSKNTVTWNEMIHGYAQNGRGEEAVSLYKEMIKSGEIPDTITFVAVLTGCSHSGLTDLGLEIFESMEREHRVEPALDHYTCVVDSLGRAGRFEEAEALLDRMPCRDDPVVWEVLLSCCRLHSNVDLAKRAADELFRLSPSDASPYVLLGNIYSSLGRWDEARAVRDAMSDKQIKKNPGYSWEVDGVKDLDFLLMSHWCL